MKFSSTSPRTNKRVKKWFGYSIDEWSYGKTIKGGKYRDFQRQKVYKAEDDFYKLTNRIPSFQHKNDVIHFINGILSDKKFIRLYGEFKIINLEFIDENYETFPAWSRAYEGVNFIDMILPKWAWNAPSILHELAHGICPYNANHGALFCYVHLQLVGLVIGKEVRDSLKETYDKYKIYHKPYKLAARSAASAATATASSTRPTIGVSPTITTRPTI